MDPRTGSQEVTASYGSPLKPPGEELVDLLQPNVSSGSSSRSVAAESHRRRGIAAVMALAMLGSAALGEQSATPSTACAPTPESLSAARTGKRAAASSARGPGLWLQASRWVADQVEESLSDGLGGRVGSHPHEVGYDFSHRIARVGWQP